MFLKHITLANRKILITPNSRESRLKSTIFWLIDELTKQNVANHIPKV
jgi:hypothetical protein